MTVQTFKKAELINRIQAKVKGCAPSLSTLPMLGEYCGLEKDVFTNPDIHKIWRQFVDEQNEAAQKALSALQNELAQL